MNRKEALTDLLARVEAGVALSGNAEFWENADRVFVSNHDLSSLVSVLHGSLDAAKALHEAVLPQHGALVRMDGSTQVLRDRDGRRFHGAAKDPARAWLIAIIKALIAECDENETAPQIVQVKTT